jgi:polyhydroxyalkanoate depolymerase
MLYHAYEARRRLIAPLYGLAALNARGVRRLPPRLAGTAAARRSLAASEVTAALRLTHERPAFGIDATTVGGRTVAVRELPVTSTPFGTLVHFAKDGAEGQPRVLVVAGLAGHFATLLRGTVRTLLPDHDVYITDWHNARDISPAHGPFGLDEYVAHLIDFQRAIGPGTHLMAVCQPCVPALAAAAIMAQDDDPARPQSLILMAGPVDARVNPGRLNEFARRHSRAQLERTVIATVPRPHAGAGRRVYPGFLQVAGFMGLDPRRHAGAFRGLFADVTDGRETESERTREFYAEYFTVLDVTAEYYLDTVRAVFHDHDMANGRFQWRGRFADVGRIDTALLTIEAENDELSRPGQTQAAHHLCTGIPEDRRRHHLQPGVGHYGVFSGSRFEAEIYPEIRSFVAAYD